MIIRWLLAFAILVGFTATASAQSSRDDLRNRYGILLERNMFLKDRRPAPPRDERPREEAPPPPIESLYVVIGLVEEEDAFRVHVEDRQTGQLLLLKPGDELAQGRIETVDLDGVVYASGETKTRVVIGQDLRGEAAIAPAPASPSSSNASEGSSASGNSNAPADGAAMSIEERMRQRRLQGGRQ